jgi:hypothetical protein
MTSHSSISSATFERYGSNSLLLPTSFEAQQLYDHALIHALQSAFKHVLKYCTEKKRESSILSR